MPTQKTSIIKSSASERPSNVNAIAVMTIISGGINLVASLGITFGVAITLIGLICVPITILPAILGVFEIQPTPAG